MRRLALVALCLRARRLLVGSPKAEPQTKMNAVTEAANAKDVAALPVAVVTSLQRSPAAERQRRHHDDQGAGPQEGRRPASGRTEALGAGAEPEAVSVAITVALAVSVALTVPSPSPSPSRASRRVWCPASTVSASGELRPPGGRSQS